MIKPTKLKLLQQHPDNNNGLIRWWQNTPRDNSPTHTWCKMLHKSSKVRNQTTRRIRCDGYQVLIYIKLRLHGDQTARNVLYHERRRTYIHFTYLASSNASS